MEFVIMVVLIGLLPAAIAQSKGRSFVAWWVYGMAMFVVALPHALMAKNLKEATAEKERIVKAEGSKICPHCAETVKLAANVCRFCGRDLPENDLSPVVVQNGDPKPNAVYFRKCDGEPRCIEMEPGADVAAIADRIPYGALILQPSGAQMNRPVNFP